MTPWILGARALAGPVVVSEIGGDSASDVADWSYKTDVIAVTSAVRLIRIAPRLRYAPTTGGDALHFVVYEETAAGAWVLRWDSGPEAVGTDDAFKPSPEIDLQLVPGIRYAVGWMALAGDYQHWFDERAGTADLGWGTVEGALWSEEDQTEALPQQIEAAVGDRRYWTRIEVELLDVDGDGATEDVDCDDEDASLYPDAAERCDGVDEDCDGVVDDDVVYADGWIDFDGDGFGDRALPTPWCEREPPPGVVANALDCDDRDPAVHPDAGEVCDGVDGDCDGVIDDGLPPATWFVDADADGYGSPDGAFAWCNVMPPGAAANGEDCDDTDPARFPGHAEACDGLDNDCDGAVPTAEGDDDADGAMDCADCGPADPTVFPGATEPCDGVDHDCDGTIPPRRACDPAPGEPLELVAVGCGCGAVPTGGAGSRSPPAGAIALLAAARARRRGRGPAAR